MAGGTFDVPWLIPLSASAVFLENEAAGARVAMELELMGRGDLNDSHQL
jgi:hypothetical protein